MHTAVTMQPQLRCALFVNGVLLYPAIAAEQLPSYQSTDYASDHCVACSAMCNMRREIYQRLQPCHNHLSQLNASDLAAIIYCTARYMLELLRRRQSSDCTCLSNMKFHWMILVKPAIGSEEPDWLAETTTNAITELMYCRLLLAQSIFAHACRSTESSDVGTTINKLIACASVLKTIEQSAAATSDVSKIVTNQFAASLRNYVIGYSLLYIIQRKLPDASHNSQNRGYEQLQYLASRAEQSMRAGLQCLISNKIVSSADRILTHYQWPAVKASVLQLYFACYRLYVPISEAATASSTAIEQLPNECGRAICVLNEAIGRIESYTRWGILLPTAIRAIFKDDANELLEVLRARLTMFTEHNNTSNGDTIPAAYSVTMLPVTTVTDGQKILAAFDVAENLARIMDMFPTADQSSMRHIPDYKGIAAKQLTAIPSPSSSSASSAVTLPACMNVAHTGDSRSSQTMPAQTMTISYNQSFVASILRQVNFPVSHCSGPHVYELAYSEQRQVVSTWATAIENGIVTLLDLKRCIQPTVSVFIDRLDMINAYSKALALDELLLAQTAKVKRGITAYLNNIVPYHVADDTLKFQALFTVLENDMMDDFPVLVSMALAYAHRTTVLDEISETISNLKGAIAFYTTLWQTIKHMPSFQTRSSATSTSTATGTTTTTSSSSGSSTNQ